MRAPAPCRSPAGRRLLVALLCLPLLCLALRSGADEPNSGSDAEVAAARAVFEANLGAIRNRDRDAYLATYLHSESLARNGITGPALGYEDFAAAAGEGWPDVFDAADLQLVPIAPGVVYGSYRYRVAYGSDEQIGISERLFVRTGDGWRIAVTSAFPAPAGVPSPPLALVGATLIDGTGGPPITDAAVVLRGGAIDCAGSRQDCPVPEGVETLNLAGRWLTPGLIDAHVHFSQTGWADGRPDSLDVRATHPYEQTQARLRESPEPFLRSYLCSGVTSVFDVGGYPWTLDLAHGRLAAEGGGGRSELNTLSPRITAAGPLLSTLDFWLNLPGERQFIHLTDEGSARDGVAYLASRGSSAIKVWFINREGSDLAAMAAAVRAAGEAARRQNLPLIVHATGLAEAKEAVRAGAHLLVHSVWDQEVDEEFIALMREHGTLYNPTLTVPGGYLRMARSVLSGEPPEVDDPNGCVDSLTLTHLRQTAEQGGERVDTELMRRQEESLARREAIGAANLKLLAASGVPIVMGTDAGNPLTLHGPSVYAEMEAMQAAGLSPVQVLVSATRNAARALGREEELGTIEAGKAADLLVLTADPTADAAAFRTLTHVIRGGELRGVDELRAPEPPNTP